MVRTTRWTVIARRAASRPATPVAMPRRILAAATGRQEMAATATVARTAAIQQNSGVNVWPGSAGSQAAFSRQTV